MTRTWSSVWRHTSFCTRNIYRSQPRDDTVKRPYPLTPNIRDRNNLGYFTFIFREFSWQPISGYPADTWVIILLLFPRFLTSLLININSSVGPDCMTIFTSVKINLFSTVSLRKNRQKLQTASQYRAATLSPWKVEGSIGWPVVLARAYWAYQAVGYSSPILTSKLRVHPRQARYF